MNTSNLQILNIPKIIHQIAPQNQDVWSQTWKECHLTWFWKDWIHKQWNDEEDMRNFILEHHSSFIPIYDSLDSKIKKIDVFRFFLMYYEGGIYVDMDFECCIPFNQIINEKEIYLVESPFTDLERLHNSLMISKPHHPFWMQCIQEVEKTKDLNVIDATGPRFLDRIYKSYSLKESISILPFHLWNPPIWNPLLFKSKDVITRHYSTMTWKPQNEIQLFQQKYNFTF